VCLLHVPVESPTDTVSPCVSKGGIVNTSDVTHVYVLSRGNTVEDRLANSVEFSSMTTPMSRLTGTSLERRVMVVRL
jgi:hypothetical protein